MSTHRKVVRSAGILGGLTGISRVLGFVRDMVIASAFGTGMAAEAFVVSFKIPNLLRDLVGEGAMNSAFVPVLTECREKRREDFWRLVTSLLCIMAGLLAVLSALGMIFAPQIVGLLAPGFLHSVDPEKFPLTVHLTRVIFPYLFLIGLSALAMGVLNSMHEFASSALGPILLNLAMITAGFFFEPRFGPIALVVGVLAGGVLQLGCQVPALLKSGFVFRKPSLKDPGVAKIARLLIPRAAGSAIYQVNVFVDSILASFDRIVGAGGQSALYYANRFFQLPLAIFGVALAQALLPTFSAQMVNGDLKGFKASLAMAIRLLLLVALPSTAGLLALSGPIIRIIFERGRFDAYSTAITSQALFYYAFGLVACCFIKALVNAFYAMQDTRTPVKTALICVIVNIALSLVLMRWLRIGGLALSSSVSATLNSVLLYLALRRRIGSLEGRVILWAAARMLAAAVLMGLFAWWYGARVLDTSLFDPRPKQALLLAGGILASIAIYAAAAYLLGVEELRKVFSRLRG